MGDASWLWHSVPVARLNCLGFGSAPTSCGGSSHVTSWLLRRGIRERAVRMVVEIRPQYESEYAAIGAVAKKLGCPPPTAGAHRSSRARASSAYRPYATWRRTSVASQRRIGQRGILLFVLCGCWLAGRRGSFIVVRRCWMGVGLVARLEAFIY
jgi:hypothetical protein